MATRQEIVAAARRYLGVRWVHQGRTARGLDCLGLVIRTAQDVGLTREDFTAYARIPDGGRLLAELRKRLQPAPRPQPGDVLVMRFDRWPIHVALCTDVGAIHAAAQFRRVVEHRLDAQWQARVCGAFTLPGVEAAHG